jgi:hypothetical protein
MNESAVASIKTSKKMTQMLYHLDASTNPDTLPSIISALLDVTLVASRSPFSHAHDNSAITAAPTDMLTNLLCGVFQSLDTDNDGYLTAADFSAQGTYVTPYSTSNTLIPNLMQCCLFLTISHLSSSCLIYNRAFLRGYKAPSRAVYPLLPWGQQGAGVIHFLCILILTWPTLY